MFNREANGNYSNTPFQTLEDPFAQDNDTFGSDIALTEDFLAISSLQKALVQGKSHCLQKIWFPTNGITIYLFGLMKTEA